MLERGPDGEDSYLTADGPRKFELESETLEVAGGEIRDTRSPEDDLGPGDRRVTATVTRLRSPGPRIVRGATDMALFRLERADDLDAAAAIIGGAGMPGQNVMIADRAWSHRLGAFGPVAAAPGYRSVATLVLAARRAPAGMAGSRRLNRRACWIRRRAMPGAPMRGSSAARPIA